MFLWRIYCRADNGRNAPRYKYLRPKLCTVIENCCSYTCASVVLVTFPFWRWSVFKAAPGPDPERHSSSSLVNEQWFLTTFSRPEMSSYFWCYALRINSYWGTVLSRNGRQNEKGKRDVHWETRTKCDEFLVQSIAKETLLASRRKRGLNRIGNTSPGTPDTNIESSLFQRGEQ